MVFSINAVESGPNNFNAFRQLAMRPTNTSSSTNGGGSNNGGSSGNNNSGNNSAAVAVSSRSAIALTALVGAFSLVAAFL